MLQLETPRLILRDWIEDDWPLIWTLASDPAVTRYQTKLRGLPDEAACRRWLGDAIHHNHQEPRFAYSTAVIVKETSRAVGWLNWVESSDPAKGDVSFGYALLPELWRRGYMSEAVHTMLGYVFEVQRRNSVYATCASSNPASAGVLEKAGLALVERWMHRDDDLGLEEEYRRYRVDRSDWPR
jgi:RimJ/RimL family protein N-acetyltransferase